VKSYASILRTNNVDPMKSITKVANKANLNEKRVLQTLSIMKDLNERETSAGKNPMLVTATALHLACNMTCDKIMQENLVNAAGATLRNRSKELRWQLQSD
jgi:transcription initiation factor TFIIIB Brf1 subunit/transcription initiation factor TFIIB